MVERDPAAVLTALDAALNAHNLEAALSCFADDAVVRYEPPPPPPSPATYVGREAIRGLLQTLIAENIHVQAEPYQVEGEWVTCRERRIFADRHERMGGNPVIVTCDSIVRAGKIEALVMTFSPESLQRIQAALARQTGPG